MASRKGDRQKSKGRRSGHTFLRLPNYMLNHDSYIGLSHKAKAMLIELGNQYNGSNNGDLTATFKLLKPRGWTSNDVITKSIRELIDAGFVLLTRQGGRKIPNLYAITWNPIDECGGKLEIAPTRTAPNNWRGNNVSFTPPHGSMCTDRRFNRDEKVVPLHCQAVHKGKI